MQRSYQRAGSDAALSHAHRSIKAAAPGHHSNHRDNQSAQAHRPNHTGVPDKLKNHLEAHGGYDLSDLRVHRNSSFPTRVHAHAYTQGNNIFLAAGQEHLLAHEAWHAVQQKQGRVNPASPLNAINAEPHLEHEANSIMATPVAPEMMRSALMQRSTPASAIQLAPNQEGTCDPETLLAEVRQLEADGLSRSEILDRVSENHGGNIDRYFYTDRYGWVDIRHFGAAGSYAQSTGSVVAEGLGLGNEVMQWLTEWGDDYRSGFSPEDVPSNAAGAEFGDDFYSDDELLSESLARWMSDAGARAATDPAAHADALPATDPAARGGADRGSSNVSRTQSTVSGEINEMENEWSRGWRMINTPEYWMQLYGVGY